MRATMVAAYRATGADPPWGDPRGYHGVGMEGYFWRVTQPPAGGGGARVLRAPTDARDGGGRRRAHGDQPGRAWRPVGPSRARRPPGWVRALGHRRARTGGPPPAGRAPGGRRGAARPRRRRRAAAG